MDIWKPAREIKIRKIINIVPQTVVGSYIRILIAKLNRMLKLILVVVRNYLHRMIMGVT